ncbi:Protein of unknown function (DUF2283) [Candidatus Nitrososphaera evergladensis SR1]|jgi:uncharacterized protein YuzE|uniref:DUF2283 domain-containing protein n=1 Tax=Candidatus Nitrososphaera evergladensis SR1 TaxID=1459636 RepID=A0A075MNR2_9ARCH|nr:DUF2283 domain-containing protein [Candidatus Nitrososphaera evergladensis]AIF82770.1 Protein of unknown function (DUF2283) [Candidatus Nitrososphaera evergladensis SR1]
MALVTFDPDAKTMYVSLEKKKVRIAKTIPMGEGKYLDVTENNEPVGLEIILPRNVSEEVVDAIVNRGKSKIEVKH